MTLLEALRRAAALLPPKTDAGHGRILRLRPADDSAPAQLCLHDPTLTVWLSLDANAEVGSLPACAWGVDPLLPVLSRACSVRLVGKGDRDGTLSFEVPSAGGQIAHFATVDVPLRSLPKLPKLDAKQAFTPLPPGAAPSAVLHALGGDDPDMPHFAYCVLSAEGVAATDMCRIATYALAMPWCGLVDRRLFARWPKGACDVAVGCAPNGVCVRIGPDEQRFAPYQAGTQEDLFGRAEAQAPWTGPRAHVARVGLAASVGQASAHRRPGAICLALGRGRVAVEARSEQSNEAYDCQLDAHIDGPAGRVTLLGAYLREALMAASTPKVRLGYSGPDDPLRVEAGRLTAAIWPYYVDG